MAAKVRLKDIVDALQIHFEDSASFVNLDTGAVETVDTKVLGEVEDSEDDDDGEEGDEEWELAKQILCSGRFLRLPDQFEINEWAIMDQFARSAKKSSVRDELLDAIHGNGAFRMFKSAVRRLGIEQNWFAFRDGALRTIARAWCEKHQIEWL